MSYRSIKVPPEVASREVIASVSGGKDSTALVLALREAGIPHRMVFADTQWEAREIYEHLDVLRRHLGQIDVVGVEGGMEARARNRAGFPARMQRWCTRELKIEPLRAYHERIAEEQGRDTVGAMGVRAQESPRRAAMVEWEWDDRWDGYVWRPIFGWTVEDVLAIHHRHGVPLNPLYHAGFSRVGCWPCIYASKEEIRLMADRDPERVSRIDALEREIEGDRAQRNVEKPGRYAHKTAAYFLDRSQRMGSSAMHIRDVVAWAQTTRGGKQLPLLREPPEGGCMRWGMCDPPVADEV